MDKHNVIYLYNSILFSSKKGQNTDTYYDMNGPQKHYAKLKKPDKRLHVYHDPIYMKYEEKINLQIQKVDYSLPRVGSRKREQQ